MATTDKGKCRCGATITGGRNRTYCEACAEVRRSLQAEYANLEAEGNTIGEPCSKFVNRKYEEWLEKDVIDHPREARRCLYCGRTFVSGTGLYCASCVRDGLHFVHEVTGRTNGWDKRRIAS